MRVRFAPSPTGQLHVGNARTALFNWLLARGRRRRAGHLHPADRGHRRRAIDPRVRGRDRPRPPLARARLGRGSRRRRLVTVPTASPSGCTSISRTRRNCSAPAPPTTASARPNSSKRSGRRRSTPDVPCSIPARAAISRTEEVTTRIAAGEQPAIRFRVPEGSDVVFTDLVRGEVRFQGEVIGDPVILRADGTPAYNFAVVVDDALMEVTHVIRGEDHLSNTPRQLLLYEALGFTPPQFAHLALVMGPDHSPLSKRHGATSVAEFRAKGYLPEALVNYLALDRLVASGDDAELLPIEELARRFSLERVGHSPGVFDEEKLAWVNRHYLKMADPGRIARAVGAVFRRRRRADDARRSRHAVSGRGDVDGDVVGRSAQSGAGAAGVPVRLRRGADAGRCAGAAEMSGEGARAVGCRPGRGAGGGAAPRSRTIPGGRQPGEGANRPEGEGAVPSDSRRADRDGRKARSSIWRCRRSTAARTCRATPVSRRFSGCRERARQFVERSHTDDSEARGSLTCGSSCLRVS